MATKVEFCTILWPSVRLMCFITAAFNNYGMSGDLAIKAVQDLSLSQVLHHLKDKTLGNAFCIEAAVKHLEEGTVFGETTWNNQGSLHYLFMHSTYDSLQQILVLCWSRLSISEQVARQKSLTQSPAGNSNSHQSLIGCVSFTNHKERVFSTSIVAVLKNWTAWKYIPHSFQPVSVPLKLQVALGVEIVYKKKRFPNQQITFIHSYVKKTPLHSNTVWHTSHWQK